MTDKTLSLKARLTAGRRLSATPRGVGKLSGLVVLLGAFATIAILVALAIYQGYITQAQAGNLSYGEWGIVGAVLAALAIFIDMGER